MQKASERGPPQARSREAAMMRPPHLHLHSRPCSPCNDREVAYSGDPLTKKRTSQDPAVGLCLESYGRPKRVDVFLWARYPYGVNLLIRNRDPENARLPFLFFYEMQENALPLFLNSEEMHQKRRRSASELFRKHEKCSPCFFTFSLTALAALTAPLPPLAVARDTPPPPHYPISPRPHCCPPPVPLHHGALFPLLYWSYWSFNEHSTSATHVGVFLDSTTGWAQCFVFRKKKPASSFLFIKKPIEDVRPKGFRH